MLARILGFVDVDRFVSPVELQAALKLKYHTNYSAFVFGVWSNCVLWNETGAADDCDLRKYEGAGQPTGNLAHLPGLCSLIESCFERDRLKWLRLFRQDSGVLLPHIDFIGMGEGFERLHIALVTGPGALHSEVDEVYHMRTGEIWRLEALRAHSASNLSGQTRLSLCADFAPGVAPESLIRQPFREAATYLQPEMIQRSTFKSDDRQALDDLTVLLSEGGWEEVITRLIGVHFEKHVASSEMFEWLNDLTAQTHDVQLVRRARELRRLALGA